MPAVADLIPLLRAFNNEAAYLTYMEDYVGACLAALTVAVGNDRLWKPLNNKVNITFCCVFVVVLLHCRLVPYPKCHPNSFSI